MSIHKYTSLSICTTQSIAVEENYDILSLHQDLYMLLYRGR
jgi:hypothetical protein